MKKLVAIFMALVTSLAFAATAQAANETVEGKTELTPRSGQFFQAKPTPANLMIRADVFTPVTSPLANPLKNVKITFPAGTSFNPKKSMPICTDAKLNQDSPLNKPAEVIAACKDSVVGTGTATILFAKQHLVPHFNITDPVLVIFNNGVDKKGQAKIKIWGYSEYTKVGILMSGTLSKGVLDVAVPVLSNDSAVKYFQFDLPGPVLDRPEINLKAEGLDPTYVKGICPASGKLLTKSQFVLGERDFATKQDIPGTEVVVDSPDTLQAPDCVGKVGSPKLKVAVKGPKAVKSGKKGTFKVTITNTGTGVAKKIKVTGTGGAKGNGGNINPEVSKTVTVKAKVAGKKGKSKTLTFSAKGAPGNKAKIKVKIK